MRLPIQNSSLLALISLLTACSSLSGNVVPEKGPTMEQVYDSEKSVNTGISLSNKPPCCAMRPATVQTSAVYHEFHKLPNPELKMYVYPHLAGKEQLPIPGYFTVFNAYTEDHYALTNETRQP